MGRKLWQGYTFLLVTVALEIIKIGRKRLFGLMFSHKFSMFSRARPEPKIPIKCALCACITDKLQDDRAQKKQKRIDVHTVHPRHTHACSGYWA